MILFPLNHLSADTLTHTHLQILNLLDLLVLLTKDKAGAPRKENWHYRSLIGMLNFLVNSTHPELAYAVHQCARFCENPKLSHERAVKKIVQYLIGTKRPNGEYSGLLFTIDKSRSLEVYVDASFTRD